MDELIVTNPDHAAFLLERGYSATIIANGVGIAWAFPIEAKEDLKNYKEEH